MSISSADPWLQPLTLPTKAPSVLFCLPYAGGNARIYRGWVQRFAPQYDLVAVELPGHGQRLTERLLSSVEQVVEALVPAICHYAGERPFAIFGHSMGALLAFALCERLHNVGATAEMLLVSACKPPHMQKNEVFLHNLADEQLTQRIIEMGGTPPEVLADPALHAMLLPILRNDFRLLECYPVRTAQRYPFAITAFGGVEDTSVALSDLQAWQDWSLQPCTIYLMPDGHFFLHSQEESVTHCILDILHSRGNFS